MSVVLLSVFAAGSLFSSPLSASPIDLTLFTTAPNLNQLQVGETVTFGVQLNGLSPGEEVDSLAATVNYNSALLGPATEPVAGSIVSAGGFFLPNGEAGQADAGYFAFDQIDNITTNGAFYTFDVQVLAAGAGNLTISFADGTFYNPNDPFDPLPSNLSPGATLSFTAITGTAAAVPEPSSIAAWLFAGSLLLVVGIFSWARRPRSSRPSSRAPRPSSHKPALESLEPRQVLAGDAVFAEYVGVLNSAGDREEILVTVRPDQVGMVTGKALLGFHISQRDGQGALDPLALSILPAGNGAAPPSIAYQKPDVSAAKDSLVIAELSAGDYLFQVMGSSNGRHPFELDVFLAGDIDGDWLVTRSDLAALQAAHGSRPGHANYSLAADINRDGQVLSSDMTLWNRAWRNSQIVAPPAGIQQGDVRITAVVPTAGHDPAAEQLYFESTTGWVQALSVVDGQHAGVVGGPRSDGFQPSLQTLGLLSGEQDTYIVSWDYREAGYNNDIYYYITDDGSGTVAGLAPTPPDPDPGESPEAYAQRSIAHRAAYQANAVATSQLLFDGGVIGNHTEPVTTTLSLPAGTFFSFFIVQNGTFPSPGNNNHLWFPYDWVNDDEYAHFDDDIETTKPYYRSDVDQQWEIEDLSPTLANPGGQVHDADYQDVVLSIKTAIVVNSTDDDADANLSDGLPTTGQLNSEGLPEVTLRSAMQHANVESGFDIILFAIPAIDPGYAGGIFTISPQSALPMIDGQLTILGESQSGYSDNPVIQIDGSSATASGFVINAAQSAISALAIHSFSGSGIVINSAGNVLEAMFIGLAADGNTGKGNGGYGIEINNKSNNVVHNDNAISDNEKAGIRITGADAKGNRIEGNLIGTNNAGDAAIGNKEHGIALEGGANGNIIGGDTPEKGNVVSGNAFSGVLIDGSGTKNNIVANNLIGTDKSGLTAIGNAKRGVLIEDGASENKVEFNLISGNAEHGVQITAGQTTDAAHSNTVLGNHIGTKLGGTGMLGNGQSGIVIDSGSSHNRVGSDGDGDGDLAEGNLIAFNEDDGIIVRGNSTQNAIRTNIIVGNGELPVDLENDGITPNSWILPGVLEDNETGRANQFQNYPVLNSWSDTGEDIAIYGHLWSTPNSNFRVEFFGGDQLTASGHVMAEEFLGALDVTTGSSGFAEIVFLVPRGKFVSATATDAHGNTSEYSLALNLQASWETFGDNLPLSRDSENYPVDAEGLQIFPGRKSFEDQGSALRRIVTMRVDTGIAEAGQSVFFRVFDVDDSASHEAIDSDSTGNDNRGDGQPEVGYVTLDSDDPTVVSDIDDDLDQTVEVETNANGVAELLFSVSMKPGDNYRFLASTDETLIADATNEMASTGAGLAAGVMRSELLTVWRKLHIEEDSLAFPGVGLGAFWLFDDEAHPNDIGDPGNVDVTFRSPSLAMLQTQMRYAFIEVVTDLVEATDDSPFKRNIETKNAAGEGISHEPGGLVRDVESLEDFWVVQVFAAYEGPESADGDGPEEAPDPFISLGFANGPRGTYPEDSPVNIYLESIRDVVAARTAAGLPVTTEAKLIERTVLHEVLHKFGDLRHGVAPGDEGPLNSDANLTGDDFDNQITAAIIDKIRDTIEPKSGP